MKFTVSTPLAIVVEADDVAHIRAEDATGAFGVLTRHAEFLTVLSTSVITWRRYDGREHHVAVRGGVFKVHGGERVTVATREAVSADDLSWLESAVLRRFRLTNEQERAARADAQRLYLSALRRIIAYLRPEQRPTLRRTGRRTTQSPLP